MTLSYWLIYILFQWLSQTFTHAATTLLSLILSLRCVARIQTGLISCDTSQGQNYVAAKQIVARMHHVSKRSISFLNLPASSSSACRTDFLWSGSVGYSCHVTRDDMPQQLVAATCCSVPNFIWSVIEGVSLAMKELDFILTYISFVKHCPLKYITVQWIA